MLILGRDGYQALTTRAIAEEAGVNQALINYHFGTKQNLLLAIMDEMDKPRFNRQRAMYDEPGVPLSAKWRQAVEFYRQDLADGFVRINHELIILGYKDERIAKRTRDRVAAWVDLLNEVAEEYFPQLGINLPPWLVVDALNKFWFGMDGFQFAGFTDDLFQVFETLDLVGDWLEERERQVERGEVKPVAPETLIRTGCAERPSEH